MTKSKSRSIWGGVMSLGGMIIVFLIATYLSDEIESGMLHGMMIAVKRVLPLTMPFMIICDFLITYVRVDDIPLVPSLVTRLYSIPRESVTPLILGSMCGFPLGARMSRELYAQGALTKSELILSAAYSSMPSEAFVIGVVGGGMLGDTRLGVLLYFSIILATLFTAQIFRQNSDVNQKSNINIRQSFDFISSVKSSARASITLISFISIFSVLGDMIGKFVPFAPLKTALITLVEVSGACEYLSLAFDNILLKIGMLAFALGFGGLCVILQCLSFIDGGRGESFRFVLIRLVIGLFSSVISAGLYTLFYIIL